MEDELIYRGDEIKAEKQEGGGVKLGGYLVRFSDASAPDLTGDYFTKETDFDGATQSSTWFNHRMPVKLKKVDKQVVYKDPLPKANLTFDDVGVFADIVIEARNEYEQTIAELGLAGKLAWSSGTAPHLVDRKSISEGINEITRWPLGLDASLTPSPAEFRKTNQIMSIKSLLEDNKMETENKVDVKSEVAEAVKAALAVRDAEVKAEADRQAAIKTAEDAGYQKAVEEIKAQGIPAFNKITTPGFSEEKDAVPAFKHWVATGQVNQALIVPDASYNNIKAAWNVTTGASGAFLVPDPLYNQIVAKRDIASWIRQAPVTKLQTPADHLLVPYEDTSQTAFTLTAEAAAYNEDEGTMAQKDLILYKYTKLVKMSEEFVNFQGTNFETWLVDSLGRAEAATENTFATSGNGSGQPQGLANGATASGLTIKTSAQLNPEDLSAMIGKLGGGYNVPSECGFVGANTSKWYVKNSILAGPFAYIGAQGGAPAPEFFGYPWYVSDDVQSYTATSGTVLYFGNLSYLALVEKPGMTVQRNPYLFMANGQVGIYANIFRGFGVLQSEAIYSVNGK